MLYRKRLRQQFLPIIPQNSGPPSSGTDRFGYLVHLIFDSAYAVSSAAFYRGQWHTLRHSNDFDSAACQLVLLFWAGSVVTDPAIFATKRAEFPNAHIVSCSTSGEIVADAVFDETIALTAIQFGHTRIRCAQMNVNQHTSSFETGKNLMKELDAADLVTVFVLSEGSFSNGSELVNGFNENNSRSISITGGMAGDADRFPKTQVGLDAPAAEGNVVAIGFCENNLQAGHSSFGGRDEFGRSALDLYKEYLGPYVDALPGSALFFPLSMRVGNDGQSLVRTILGINEVDKSMIFAGNLPEGSKVRLMKANFDKIINGSSVAATHALQERTCEEVKATRKVLGPDTVITGFYSYGEISPLGKLTNCELHNQTMTITTFAEI